MDQQFCPFKTSTVFCSSCGMLLRLESTTTKTTCKFCQTVTDIKGKLILLIKYRFCIDHMNDEVVTIKKLSKNKDWLKDNSKNEAIERATVEQDCE